MNLFRYLEKSWTLSRHPICLFTYLKVFSASAVSFIYLCRCPTHVYLTRTDILSTFCDAQQIYRSLSKLLSFIYLCRCEQKMYLFHGLIFYPPSLTPDKFISLSRSWEVLSFFDDTWQMGIFGKFYISFLKLQNCIFAEDWKIYLPLPTVKCFCSCRSWKALSTFADAWKLYASYLAPENYICFICLSEYTLQANALRLYLSFLTVVSDADSHSMSVRFSLFFFCLAIVPLSLSFSKVIKKTQKNRMVIVNTMA